eukprot:TRINITY_DN7947_c0_g1_i1.p2 TRINITY_DN7947_c0_g1~~TRINITY_DN7947_c0_g1_i1.p2  ORF type:complete len:119 (-),score=30.07 TRINITY_DN7947_c0_g1_i1:47-403(-)
MIVGVPASMAATAEFVVPRSMPTTFSPGATSARAATREARERRLRRAATAEAEAAATVAVAAAAELPLKSEAEAWPRPAVRGAGLPGTPGATKPSPKLAHAAPITAVFFEDDIARTQG